MSLPNNIAPGSQSDRDARNQRLVENDGMENDLTDPARSDERRRLWWLDRLAEPRLAIPFLLAFGLLIFVVNLGGYPIYTTGEPREAIRILDLYQGANFILPSQAGIGLPWKPPLMYWFGALVSVLAGRVNEWTVRLPSAILAIGGVLVCYLYVNRLLDCRTALMAAVILATSFQYLQAAAAARVDMTLTFFMEVAFFEFLMIAEGLTRRRMLMYGAIAAAILAKGPIGAFLPAVVALIWMLVEGRLRLLRDLRLLRGAALVLVLAGGWYLAASIIGGMDFVHRQLLDENIYRLIPNRAVHEPHAHPFYFIELALLAGFLPWSAMIPLAIVQFVRAHRPLNSRLTYLIAWLITVLLFYNFPQSKRGVYLLALYPSLSTLTASFLNEAFSGPQRAAQLARVIEWTAGLLSLLLGTAVLLLEVATFVSGRHLLAAVLRPFRIDGSHLAPELVVATVAHPMLSVFLPIALAVSGIYLFRSKDTPERPFVGVAAAWCCAVLATRLVLVPAVANTLTLKQFTLQSMQIVGDKKVASIGGTNFDVVFYSQRDIADVGFGDALKTDYLLCKQKMCNLLPESVRERFTTVLVSGPTELDGTGQMLLLRHVEPGSKSTASGV